MNIMQRLSDIPPHSEVAIFGAGQAGENVMKILQTFRRDLTIVCFIDCFKQGYNEGIPIVGIQYFQIYYARSTLILIASIAWREMECRLVGKEITHYLILPPRFFVPSGFSNLSRNSKLEANENPLSGDLFSETDREQFRDQLEQAENLLEQQDDIQLFRLLTGGCGVGQKRIDGVTAYYYGSRLRGQYFDFIDYRHVRTIIEGGVADGGDTVKFLKAAPPGCRIYGFEPNIADYDCGIYCSQLATNSNVVISPVGLWETQRRIPFEVSGLSSRIAAELPQNTSAGAGQSIEVTSIDQFVEDNHIEKVDFIKMDIEGAELEALKGAVATLKRDRPQLAICLYHKKEHFFQIPLFLNRLLDNYTYRIGHYTAGTLETVWYGIPQE